MKFPQHEIVAWLYDLISEDLQVNKGMWYSILFFSSLEVSVFLPPSG